AAKYWGDYAKLDETKRPSVTFLVKEAGGTLTGDAAAPLAPFWPFLGLMLLHSVFYVPTISITNAIAFNAFTDPDKQFGPVRLWGTIGWIAASWPFIFILTNWAVVPAFGSVGIGEWLGKVFASPLGGAAELDGKKYVFMASGIASLVLALFSLTLPHTPPKPATGEDSLAWLKAMKLLAKPFVLVLFVVTFIDAAVHQSYFFWTFDFLAGPVGIPANWAGATMKIGQVAEVVTMLALGWVLKTFGWRLTMTVGVLGHVARFAVFAFFPETTPVVLVIALHGICYAFFFATVYIFVDKYFPKDVRSSAQGLFNVLILGVGPFVANFACEQLKGKYSAGGVVEYPAVFQYSMYAGLVGALMLLLFFHPPKEPRQVG
ncbi:MAG: MFS transporter, partial [Gemmataceae bacterium]